MFYLVVKVALVLLVAAGAVGWLIQRARRDSFFRRTAPKSWTVPSSRPPSIVPENWMLPELRDVFIYRGVIITVVGYGKRMPSGEWKPGIMCSYRDPLRYEQRIHFTVEQWVRSKPSPWLHPVEETLPSTDPTAPPITRVGDGYFLDLTGKDSAPVEAAKNA